MKTDGVVESSGERDRRQPSTSTAKRKRTGTAGRQGLVTGAKVLDACGVEHVIRAMRHGYVHCIRFVTISAWHEEPGEFHVPSNGQHGTSGTIVVAAQHLGI